jgi:hypothetical protein
MMTMAAAADRDDATPPMSDEVAALLRTVEEFKRANQLLQAENAALAAKNAELRQDVPDDPDLRPLKSLCTSPSEYEAARRAARHEVLRVERRGGRRLYSTSLWFARWRRLTGRNR